MTKTMTNGEKFKTAEERRKAYDKYCEECKKEGFVLHNVLDWLDLEYKAELKLCPFCGTEARLISGTEDHYVVCRNADCAAALVARSFSSEEEAIDAWNRRAR
jgi:Lar family restriction alleviation protein